MNPPGLYHPALMTSLPGFTERLTIEEAIAPPDDAGEPVPEWVPVPGLIGIPAHIMPVEAAVLGEQPTATATPVFADYEAVLNGIYPGITVGMRARWEVRGTGGEPFTRGEFGDDAGAVELLLDIVRRVPTPVMTTLLLREVVP